MAVIAFGLAFFFVDPQKPHATAPDPFTGNLCAAAAGVAWALTLLALRWTGTSARDAGSALAPVVVGNTIACVVALPFALPVSGATAVDWAVLAYLGVLQIGVAYLCLTLGIRRVPAFTASLLLLVEPALNPVWAWLVHGERPGVWAVAGGILIIGATTTRALQRRPR
jgi:drug/metabolite transporter (DMT)-like permease